MALTIEHLKKLLLYLISKRPQATKTTLVKLSFLIDHAYAHQIKKNESYSTVTYVKYNYGPYAEAFAEALGQLEQEKKIKTEIEFSLFQKFSYVLLINESEIKIKDKRIEEMIEKIIGENTNKSLSEIVEVVYKLEEVKNTPFLKEIVLFSGDNNGKQYNR